jgi:hypothetical protein
MRGIIGGVAGAVDELPVLREHAVELGDDGARIE